MKLNVLTVLQYIRNNSGCTIAEIVQASVGEHLDPDGVGSGISAGV